MCLLLSAALPHVNSHKIAINRQQQQQIVKKCPNFFTYSCFDNIFHPLSVVLTVANESSVTSAFVAT